MSGMPCAGFVALGDMANALSSAGCAGGMDSCLPQVAAQIKAAIDASRAAGASSGGTSGGGSKRAKTHFAEALHVRSLAHPICGPIAPFPTCTSFLWLC